jgi:hypothetical protein
MPVVVVVVQEELTSMDLAVVVLAAEDKEVPTVVLVTMDHPIRAAVVAVQDKKEIIRQRAAQAEVALLLSPINTNDSKTSSSH